MIRALVSRPVLARQAACGLPQFMRAKRTDTKVESMTTDDFPYSRIPEGQFDRWSESTSPLPLHAFFAQHRPLMPMDRQIESSIPKGAVDSRDVVYVPIWEPQGNLLNDVGMKRIPQQTAQELGAFDIASAARMDYKTGSESMPVRSTSTYPSGDMPTHVHDTLNLIGSLLSRHNANASARNGPAGSRGTLTHLYLDAEPYVEVETDLPEIEATSVRRKRKLKMNRHKYRKRLKAQRTQRRRLGK